MQRGKYEGLISLNNLPVHDHLVQNIVGLLDVIHDVQLAHIFEIFIHGLNQIMNELQVGHLVLFKPIITYSSKSRPMMK